MLVIYVQSKKKIYINLLFVCKNINILIMTTKLHKISKILYKINIFYKNYIRTVLIII